MPQVERLDCEVLPQTYVFAKSSPWDMQEPIGSTTGVRNAELACHASVLGGLLKSIGKEVYDDITKRCLGTEGC